MVLFPFVEGNTIKINLPTILGLNLDSQRAFVYRLKEDHVLSKRMENYQCECA